MKKIVFLFPGQGSQYQGMGKELYSGFTVAAKVFEKAGDTLGFDMKKLCFEGSMEELTNTENTQPALLTVCYAAYKVLTEETGIIPDFFAGHSLGEITALTCSGAIPFDKALKIVKLRGKFMQEAAAEGGGTMAAVCGTHAQAVKDVCFTTGRNGLKVGVACYNSPEQFVISGNKEGVEKACERLERLLDAKCSILKVSAPFHTAFMEQAALRLKAALDAYKFDEIKYPVISNINALPYENSGVIARNLIKQMVMPVQWLGTMDYLNNNGVGIAVEIGPKKVLKNLLKQNRTNMTAYSFENTGDIAVLKQVLMPELKTETTKCGGSSIIGKYLTAAVCTRNRNLDEEQYKKGVIEPCGKLRKMEKDICNAGEREAADILREAMALLKTVLETKKINKDESTRIYMELSKK